MANIRLAAVIDLSDAFITSGKYLERIFQTKVENKEKQEIEYDYRGYILEEMSMCCNEMLNIKPGAEFTSFMLEEMWDKVAVFYKGTKGAVNESYIELMGSIETAVMTTVNLAIHGGRRLERVITFEGLAFEIRRVEEEKNVYPSLYVYFTMNVVKEEKKEEKK